ncbi:hypothetical protein MKW98_016561 [Papaver atlanticum]|uniref:Uncharacterized protein n=1 Tax=Papaver atlanticum TaxID=357466 RepID=A0AAD4SU10_9MAGN|nr:hypothetical protein MKW98_016561 [Papaver atlanticum]
MNMTMKGGVDFPNMLWLQKASTVKILAEVVAAGLPIAEGRPIEKGLQSSQSGFYNLIVFPFSVGLKYLFIKSNNVQNGAVGIDIQYSFPLAGKHWVFTLADNGRGGINTLTFEYHDLPHNFCEFCRRLGHRQEDCAQYMQAQNIIQHGYPLPAPPALYPPVHQQANDDMGDADNELGAFDSDSDISSPNNSHNSGNSNQTELSIHDDDDAISPVTSEELLLKIKRPNTPPIVVINPHQWDEYGFNTPEPYVNPNPYKISWEPIHNISTKRPNPSHYLYNFHPEELEAFNPIDLYPLANSDSDAASSSIAHL